MLDTTHLLAGDSTEPMDLETAILVVDDDPGIRELTAEFLTRHG